MFAGLEVPPAVEAGRVIKAVLADLLSVDHRGMVVDSLPGAGKPTLAVRVALDLAAAGEWLIIIAQASEQVDDLVDRLARIGQAHPVPDRLRPLTGNRNYLSRTTYLNSGLQQSP